MKGGGHSGFRRSEDRDRFWGFCMSISYRRLKRGFGVVYGVLWVSQFLLIQCLWGLLGFCTMLFNAAFYAPRLFFHRGFGTTVSGVSKGSEDCRVFGLLGFQDLQLWA